MIKPHVIMGLLLYSTAIRGFTEAEIKNENITLKNNENISNQTKSISETVNDAYSHIAVDTLINKVVELSDRYRNDANGTILDIQQIIQTDRSLPSLTRGEIIDLLENLTNTSPEIWKDKLEKSRRDYQRAIMLVMPYTPKTTDSLSIEELYTKPPITHIIGTQSTVSSTRKPHNPNKHVEILALNPSTYKPPFLKRRRIKPTKHSESSQEEEEKQKKEVIKQTFINPTISPYNLEDHQPETTTRTLETSTIRQKLKPVKYSNHKYPEDVSSNEGIRIINAPSLAPRPFGNSDYLETPKIVKPDTNWQSNNEEYKKNVHPTRSSAYKARITTIKPKTTTQSSLSHLDVPEDMKDAIKEVSLDTKLPKYSSQYDASSLTFTTQNSSTENVRDLLDSIGVLPKQTSTTIPDISELTDTLPHDMKDLLMSFGLIKDPNQPKEEIIQPIISQPDSEVLYTNPYSYTQFKPLPKSAPSTDDMQEFLASFGLTGNSDRSAKKIKTVEPEKTSYLSGVPNINMEMIPESMHEVMEDIGLSEKKERKISSEPSETEEKTHIFNPEQTGVSEIEIKRLNQLFGTIKRLEKLNRTATPEDLQDLDLENIRELTKILKQDTTVPLNEQYFGPNPLDFDTSSGKNELKRQQSTTSEKPFEEDSKNLAFAALEESFGGDLGAAAENVDESLPPPRKTGFYYLADWNSFLEVGEEGKNKVNIRFSPQAGDSSRFLRVKVP